MYCPARVLQALVRWQLEAQGSSRRQHPFELLDCGRAGFSTTSPALRTSRASMNTSFGLATEQRPALRASSGSVVA